MNTPTTDVSPGMWGFLVFALLGIAIYFLARNMNARMRRMSYRQRDAGREPWEPQAGDPDEGHGEDDRQDGEDDRRG